MRMKCDQVAWNVSVGILFGRERAMSEWMNIRKHKLRFGSTCGKHLWTFPFTYAEIQEMPAKNVELIVVEYYLISQLQSRES